MLKFKEDGSFTIVQFTDIHWKLGEESDRRTVEFMWWTIAAEQPDLIVVTGDVIDKKGCPEPLSAFAEAVSALCDSGVPWAFVFGNHEHECPAPIERFADMLQNMPGSLFRCGPEHIKGVSNYMLRIEASRTGRTAAALYMLDSGAKTSREFGGAEWLDRSQIGWYDEQSAALAAENGNEPLPSLAFFHIPLPEYNEVWDFHTCYGEKNKHIDSPRINSGMFAVMAERGDVMGTFVGHCHLNDFYGDLHGIRLGYCRLTGFSAKGPEEYARGARVICLREGKKGFDTWQRLADGTAVTDPLVHPPMYIDPFGKRNSNTHPAE